MKLLTIAEAAEALAVSKSLVYRLVESGELPYVQVGASKAYRIDADDLREFIQRRKVRGGARSRAGPPPRPRLKHIRL